MKNPFGKKLPAGWKHHYMKSEELLEHGNERAERKALVHALLANVGVGRGELAEVAHWEDARVIEGLDPGRTHPHPLEYCECDTPAAVIGSYDCQSCKKSIKALRP